MGYEIIKELGRGGMGVVYQVMDTKLKRVAAMKTLLNSSMNEVSGKRFIREAELSAKMSHPNIVRVYDFGITPQFYIIMEFIEGRSFQNLLEDQEYPLRKKLEILRQVCEAVDYAHQQKIIHRDLKPQNIMVTESNVAKVMDFGLAKSLAMDSLKLSMPGEVIGTPKYMSPEQVDGRKIDHRTDIYSLGVILYKILTGRTPYESDNVVNILAQLAHDKPVLPCELNPAIPKELQIICMKCLERNPQDRYASARLLANDIQAYVTNKPILMSNEKITKSIQQRIQRNKKLAGILVTLVLALVFMGIMYVTEEKKDFQRTQQLVFQQQEKQNYTEAMQLWQEFLLRFPTTSHRQEIENNIESLKKMNDQKMAIQQAQHNASELSVEAQRQAEIRRQEEERQKSSYGLPDEIWNACRYEYQGEAILDMTTDFWCRLTPKQQNEYVSKYQKGYAAVKGLLLEKIIPISSLPSSVKPMVMKLIPPGRFWMGAQDNEKVHRETEKCSNQEELLKAFGCYIKDFPRHRVVISSPYYIAKYECTQAQWKAVMGDNPSHFQNAGRDAPVESVAWNSIANGKDSFCGRTGLNLPSECQWEYACRAGTIGMSHVGNFEIKGECNAPRLSLAAWYSGNSGVVYEGGEDSSKWEEKEQKHQRAGPHLVGQKLPNGFDLYDMLGNVWEWCADNPRYYKSDDVYNPYVGQNLSYSFILRGGSWYDYPWDVRSAVRYISRPDYSEHGLGFRLASTVQ